MLGFPIVANNVGASQQVETSTSRSGTLVEVLASNLNKHFCDLIPFEVTAVFARYAASRHSNTECSTHDRTLAAEAQSTAPDVVRPLRASADTWVAA